MNKSNTFRGLLQTVREVVSDCVALNFTEKETIEEIAEILDAMFDFKYPLLEAYDKQAFEYVITKIYKRLLKRKTSRRVRDRIAARIEAIGNR